MPKTQREECTAYLAALRAWFRELGGEMRSPWADLPKEIPPVPELPRVLLQPGSALTSAEAMDLHGVANSISLVLRRVPSMRSRLPSYSGPEAEWPLDQARTTIDALVFELRELAYRIDVDWDDARRASSLLKAALSAARGLSFAGFFAEHVDDLSHTLESFQRKDAGTRSGVSRRQHSGRRILRAFEQVRSAHPKWTVAQVAARTDVVNPTTKVRYSTRHILRVVREAQQAARSKKRD